MAWLPCVLQARCELFLRAFVDSSPLRMSAAEPNGKPRPTEVAFHYIKSPAYRTVHMDGVYGGPTPTGLIEMTLFSERFPIPTFTRHNLTESGVNPVEVERIVRDGVVRELEVGAVMTPDAAKTLRDWLSKQIDMLAAARQERESGPK